MAYSCVAFAFGFSPATGLSFSLSFVDLSPWLVHSLTFGPYVHVSCSRVACSLVLYCRDISQFYLFLVTCFQVAFLRVAILGIAFLCVGAFSFCSIMSYNTSSRISAYPVLSYDKFCLIEGVVCAFCHLVFVRYPPSSPRFALSNTSWRVINVSTNAVQWIETLFDIPSSSMITVVGKFRRFWMDQLLGILIFCTDRSPTALAQKLSSLGDLCTGTVHCITSVVHFNYSCRGFHCNSVAISFACQRTVPFLLSGIAIVLVMDVEM